MGLFDRKTFFSYVRRAPFGNRLSQAQVDGLEKILAYWEGNHPKKDLRFLAYALATSFHETGGKMVPVREGFAKSDAAARKIVAKRRYGVPDATSNGKALGKPTGQVYYGRGHVQLTWKDNYDVMGRLIGRDLVNSPDLALDPYTSLQILFEGMLKGVSGKGDFTGQSLEHYFNDIKDDPVGARRIINGTDKAALIASYHANFLDSLKAAKKAADEGTTPPDVSEATATPDGANLLTDKTMLGALATGSGGAVATLIGAISNPYALAAFLVLFAVIAGGVFMMVTGRIDIKRKAGA